MGLNGSSQCMVSSKGVSLLCLRWYTSLVTSINFRLNWSRIPIRRTLRLANAIYKSVKSENLGSYIFLKWRLSLSISISHEYISNFIFVLMVQAFFVSFFVSCPFDSFCCTTIGPILLSFFLDTFLLVHFMLLQTSRRQN